jgi:hypothetical protein
VGEKENKGRGRTEEEMREMGKKKGGGIFGGGEGEK